MGIRGGRSTRRRGRARIAAASVAVLAAVVLVPSPPATAAPAPEPGVPSWGPRTPLVAPSSGAASVTYPRLVPIAPPECYSGSTRVAPTPCFYGPSRSTRRVALVIDSHGWAWWPAVQRAAARTGVRVAVFAKTACGAVETPRAYPFPTGLRAYTECPTWQIRTAAQVRVFRPQAVILSSASTAWLPVSATDLTNQRDARVRDARWSAGVTAALYRYRPIVPRVLWLTDSPVTTPAALECALRRDATPQRCGVPTWVGHAPGRRAELAAAARLRVPLLDATPRICSATWCPSFLDGRPTHRNGGHLSYDWTLTSPTARRFWSEALVRATGP